MNITINTALYLEKDLRHAYGSGCGKGCICGLTEGGRRARWWRRAGCNTRPGWAEGAGGVRCARVCVLPIPACVLCVPVLLSLAGCSFPHFTHHFSWTKPRKLEFALCSHCSSVFSPAASFVFQTVTISKLTLSHLEMENEWLVTINF